MISKARLSLLADWGKVNITYMYVCNFETCFYDYCPILVCKNGPEVNLDVFDFIYYD